MRIEARRPLKVNTHDGTILLQPGQPVDLPEARARRLLEKVPDHVRVIPSAIDLVAARSPVHGDLGRTVLVKDQVGAHALGIVVDVTIVQGQPHLKPGRWYELTVAGGTRHIHESLIVNREPVCPRCKGHRWWWAAASIQCASCSPPVPAWREAWRTLAQLTRGINGTDPRFPVVLAALDDCDQAFSEDDYATFQRAALLVHWAVTSMSI